MHSANQTSLCSFPSSQLCSFPYSPLTFHSYWEMPFTFHSSFYSLVPYLITYIFPCTLKYSSCFFFWKPQKPRATLILSKTLLGLNDDPLVCTLDLFLRAAALGLVSHFLALMSSLVPVEQSNRPTLCPPSIQPFKVHCVVFLVLGLCPLHFLSFVLSWPFSLQWDDVAELRPEITQVIQRPGFLLCAFDWY